MMVYLVVRYEEKDEVKRLGARWNPEKRKWYCRLGDIHRFGKWLPGQKVIEGIESMDQAARKPVETQMTDFSLPQCDCKTPPWEECEHTAYIDPEVVEIAKL
jgi:hypothetical protein